MLLLLTRHILLLRHHHSFVVIVAAVVLVSDRHNDPASSTATTARASEQKHLCCKIRVTCSCKLGLQIPATMIQLPEFKFNTIKSGILVHAISFNIFIMVKILHCGEKKKGKY